MFTNRLEYLSVSPHNLNLYQYRRTTSISQDTIFKSRIIMTNFVRQFRRQLGDFTKANSRVLNFGFTRVATFFYQYLIINKQNGRKVDNKSIFPRCSASPRTEKYFILFQGRMDCNLELFFNNVELGHAVQMPFRTLHSVPRSSNMNRYHSQFGA